MLKKRLLCNFDPAPRVRNEIHKSKWTPYYQTKLDGESEKNNRFVPKELFFDQIRFLEKTTLNLLFEREIYYLYLSYYLCLT